MIRANSLNALRALWFLVMTRYNSMSPRNRLRAAFELGNHPLGLVSRQVSEADGYAIERPVSPQSGATMAFTASIAGRFPVSEHGRRGRHGRAILYLEVHP